MSGRRVVDIDGEMTVVIEGGAIVNISAAWKEGHDMAAVAREAAAIAGRLEARARELREVAAMALQATSPTRQP